MKYLNADGEIVEREIFLRSENNYDMDAASLAAGIVNTEPSLAKQSFAEECDINTIVRRFGLDGALPEVPPFAEVDVTGLQMDYREALDFVRNADSEFMKMPGHVRERFANNPAALISFLAEPSNRSEAETLGLISKPVIEAPMDAPPGVQPAGDK